MRVVVAGGRGFIGTHIVHALAARGDEAVAAGRGEVVDQIGSAPTDVVVWAAGHRENDASLMRDQHVTSAVAALQCANQLTRFVYLSTGELYGAGEVPFREDATIAAVHPYAVAKAEAERALEQAALSRGVALSVLRLSLVYGRGQRPTMFLPLVVKHLAANEPLSLTPGDQTRDFVHVCDVARAVCLATMPTAPAGTFNIGSGVESSLREVAAELVAAMAADESLLRWAEQPYRLAEQMRYVFDISRAGTDLGYTPSLSLAQGIRQTVGER